MSVSAARAARLQCRRRQVSAARSTGVFTLTEPELLSRFSIFINRDPEYTCRPFQEPCRSNILAAVPDAPRRAPLGLLPLEEVEGAPGQRQ